MAFSIRFTEEERKLAESYAKIHSYSLSEAFKRALFEKIEDEYEHRFGHRTPRTQAEQYESSGVGMQRPDAAIFTILCLSSAKNGI